MVLNGELNFGYDHFTITEELELCFGTTDHKTIFKHSIGKPHYGRIYYFDKSNEAEYKQMLVNSRIEELNKDIKYYQKSILEKHRELIKVEQLKEKL
jgi:hypothetical protein